MGIFTKGRLFIKINCMNNRDYKKFAVDSYYHIYNRANGKEKIFLDDQDFGFFMLRLNQNLYPDKNKSIFRSTPLPEGSFSLINYCLMPNHYHLLIKQNKDIPTSKLISRVCTSYSKYFNKKYKRVGHIFQDQFKQVNIDSNDYLLWLSAYIHQNPRVAGLIKKPIDYRWSSYKSMGDSDGLIRDCEIILKQFKNLNDYHKFVDSSLELIKEKKDIEYLLIDTH